MVGKCIIWQREQTACDLRHSQSGSAHGKLHFPCLRLGILFRPGPASSSPPAHSILACTSWPVPVLTAQPKSESLVGLAISDPLFLQVEEFDQMHVSALADDDDGKELSTYSFESDDWDVYATKIKEAHGCQNRAPPWDWPMRALGGEDAVRALRTRLQYR